MIASKVYFTVHICITWKSKYTKINNSTTKWHDIYDKRICSDYFLNMAEYRAASYFPIGCHFNWHHYFISAKTGVVKERHWSNHVFAQFSTNSFHCIYYYQCKNMKKRKLIFFRIFHFHGNGGNNSNLIKENDVKSDQCLPIGAIQVLRNVIFLEIGPTPS